MTKEEKLTEQVQQLSKVVREFIGNCPEFPNDIGFAANIGVAMANLESTLHWEFGCWELGLPQ